MILSKEAAFKAIKTTRPELGLALENNDNGTGKVVTLLRYVEPAFSHDLCIDVLNRFIHDDRLQVVTIVNVHRNPIGIIDRSKISDIFLKPFSRDLLGKKRISDIMDHDPIIVDINASIDDVAQIMIDADMRHMGMGFIIEDQGIYAGMATSHALLEEITRRKQRDLFVLAHYDQLTGLPNRLLFKDRLLQACQNADRNQKQLALIFVDIDRFKFINDSLGHSIGDRLLQNVANRIAAKIRQSDTVARLGGDEFVIILQDIPDEAGVLHVVTEIVEYLRQPIPIYEHEIQVTASMGIALYPLHDNSVDILIRKADIAMYEVKQQGRNGYMMFVPGMENKTEQRVCLESALRQVLERNELSLNFQPQIDLQNQQIIGMEALLRWHHPELGPISPATFIPVAEESGHIIPIGAWVIRQAIAQHQAWIAQGLPALRMAINISATQFQHPGFAQSLRQIINECGIDPYYLELELTESVLMTRADHAVKTLEELHSLGITLAIDDFGTGYSSLSYLRKFPVNRVKIDRSFIRDIHNTPANKAIVKAIIALGESLGLTILAEGVETKDELLCMLAHNCLEVQGHYFCEALTPDEFPVWYQNYAHPTRLRALCG
jgi:diguanylate cyclase (GGDEF)-like protein